jgi:phospholipid/cholesterol/gamma-HCH transport system substrate-binding protein
MMGDRYVDITPGTPEAPVLPPGESLKGARLSDFDTALRQATDVLSESEKVLAAVNQQRGTLGRFVYDEKFYRNVTAITDEVEDLVKDFKKNPRRYVKFSLF